MGVSLLFTMGSKDEAQVIIFEGKRLSSQPLLVYFYVMTQSISLLILWLCLSLHYRLPFSLPVKMVLLPDTPRVNEAQGTASPQPLQEIISGDLRLHTIPSYKA